MIATQKDIAEKLHLSVNTVSRALRDMPDISAETKQRVLDAAQQMGYRKNLAASRLRTNQSHILGIVVTDFSNPAMGTFIHGVESVAKQMGYTLMLGSTNETAADENAVVTGMLAQGVDGLILIPTMLNEAILDQIERAGVSYVLAIRSYAGRACNIVRSDDRIGAAAIAQHLYQLGHRRFLYVSGLSYISSTKDRRDGFLSALRQYGLDETALEVIHCDGSRADAYRAVTHWLEQQPGVPSATAIFAFSDYVACGVYEALRARQFRIPDDFSVVGYDNNEFSNLLMPALSTMDNQFYDIGRRATGRLIAALRHPDAVPQEYVSKPELILRSSTASPAR